MRNLKDFIEEDLFATPMNTTGMGNPSDCSGDVMAFTGTGSLKRKKRKKKAKKDKEK